LGDRLRASALLLLAAGCADGLIVLGDRDPPHYRFGTPSLLAELTDGTKTDNPSLTADLREIFFTSERGGSPAEIWTARRAAPSERFGSPMLVSELNSARIETSPVVSADGLTLWLGSDRPGGLGDLDIWVSTRRARDASWSVPIDLPALSSALKDIPRPPGLHGLVMPLGSDREERGLYEIYFAKRELSSSAFGAPEKVPDVSLPAASTVDAFLTDDGTTLFYVRGPAFGPADLYVTSRRTSSEVFGAPAALTDLNTPNDERDPWLTPDGAQLFFSSDRSGRYEIYVASVKREAL
jgi:hypothetical protein